MGRGSGVIQAQVPFTVRCAGTAVAPVDCVLGYDTSDPYAVQASFTTPAGQTTWTFARDLLAFGLGAARGQGDVRVQPSHRHAVTEVELRDHPYLVRLEAPSVDLADFLSRTYNLVPQGQEPQWIDLDAEIALLLPRS